MATDLIASQLISDLKRDFGLTNEQAAGVVGNLMYESGGFNTLQEQSPTVPGSKGGFGYAQWTGDRRKAFERYANDRGLDQNSYDANYGFMKHELETDPYERRQFNTVKKADTAAEAARLVSQNYLRPGTPNLGRRQDLATQALGYSKTPIPPGELPQVASQLDTRRTAPNPASVNPLMAASRAMTSPTGGNAALQSALERVATAQRNRVTPASVDDRINARNMQFATPQPTTSDAARIAALSMGGNQTFAGQERMPSRVAPVPASVDDRINARNLSQTIVPQSFAGQERATVTPAAAQVRLPEITSSPIGQAPATRTVQSVAVPNRPSPPQSFAGMERATVTPVPKPLTNDDLALNPIPVNPLAERLPSTPMAGARATAPAPIPGNFAVSTVLDTVNPAGRLMTAPGAGVNPLMAASRIAPIPAVRPAPILRQAAIAPRPQPVMRPLMGQSPLQITVSGANRISPTPIMGTSTGRAYMPGQQYTMGGNVYTANSNSSFTNDRTGSELRGSSSGGRSLVETPDGMQWR